MTFRNVPAFATHLDCQVEVRGLGTVTVDVAYGGMFYVIADAEPLGLSLAPDEGARHRARRGDDQGRHAGATAGGASGEPGHRRRDHRAAFRAALPRGARIARTPWWSPPGTLDWSRPETWTGVIDRSPCGTGTCAKMAALHAKGQLGL